MEKLQRIRQGFFGVLFVMAKDANKEKKFYMIMLLISMHQVWQLLAVTLGVDLRVRSRQCAH